MNDAPEPDDDARNHPASPNNGGDPEEHGHPGGPGTTESDTGRRAGKANTRDRIRIGDRVTIYRDCSVSPYWNIQYNLDGRQVRRSLKTTIRSRAATITKQKDHQLGLGQAEHPDAKPVMLAAAVEQYLASLKTKGRDAQTLVGYRSKLTVFEAFCARYHVRYLRQVTAQMLEAYQAALQEAGVVPPGPRKGRRGRGFKSAANKPRTVRDKMKIVRQLIRWARKRNLIKDDPAAGYDLPPAVKDKAYCWSPEELKAVLDHAPDGFLDLFDFFRLTGLRAEELCWLTKDDLSLDRPHVKIRAKKCPLSGKPWRPKHGNERVVPLCPAALTIAEAAAAASPGPWLFYAPDTLGKQKGL